MRSDPFIIGLVGLPGAGKTTVTEYLEKHGFVGVILSDIIREELTKRGVTEYTRELLQDTGNEMRRKFGPDILAKRAISKLRRIGDGKFVIDGIRNFSEITYLQKQKNFLLIGIIAPSWIRYSRLIHRKTKKLTKTYHEFLFQERRENTLGAQTTGLRVVDCLKQCQIRIRNSTTKHMLTKQLKKLLETHHFL